MTPMGSSCYASDLAEIRRCDLHYYSCWSERISDILPLAGAIVDSEAYNRLRGITFLGILSPRFADAVSAPIFTKRPRPLPCDGSRWSHSLGVALIALDIARSLRFSEAAQRYAVAWGLLHDIGNWPLSHTGEYAFSRITSSSTRELRRRIICSDPSLPSSLWLARAVEDCGMDTATVLAFLDRRTLELSTELRQLLEVLKSALSPDALEGMWRAGQVFDVPVTHPYEFTRSFFWDLFGIKLDSGFSRRAITFWRHRRLIFQRYINRPSIVAWESAWSQAIQRCFSDCELVDSLYLSEIEIISKVLREGRPRFTSLSRYKHPIEYTIEPKHRRTLASHASLDELAGVLKERHLTLSSRDLTHAASRLGTIR